MRFGHLSRRRGAVLITFTLAIVLIFGFMGLAFDLGRLYLARNEAQSFCDAAALAGALMLNGHNVNAALDAVDGRFMTASSAAWKHYQFQNTAFAGYSVKFSQTGLDGSFVSLGRDVAAPGYRFVEVVASADIPMYLSPILTGRSNSSAQARAVGAQVKKTLWDEGLVPFAPKAHCSDSGLYDFRACTGAGAAPNLGFVVGRSYALLWAANAFSQSFGYNKKTGVITIDDSEWCGGDQLTSDQNFGESLGKFYTARSLDKNWEMTRGYWVSGQVGHNDYPKLLDGSMGGPVELHDNLEDFDIGPEQVRSLKDNMNAKAAPGGVLVYGPTVDPVTGEIIGFSSFELIPGAYGPNNTWCAIYRGPALYALGTEQVLSDGIYEVRLVR